MLDSKSFSLMQSAQALLGGGSGAGLRAGVGAGAGRPRAKVSSAAQLSFGSFSPVASPTPSDRSAAPRNQVRFAVRPISSCFESFGTGRIPDMPVCRTC